MRHALSYIQRSRTFVTYITLNVSGLEVWQQVNITLIVITLMRIQYTGNNQPQGKPYESEKLNSFEYNFKLTTLELN